MTALERVNTLHWVKADLLFLHCCGSFKWARAMQGARPFANGDALLATAERLFAGLERQDWLGAFAAHPRIGEPATGSSQEEQARVASAPRCVLAELGLANRCYEERFGHIFIVCATGKSAEEMLALLNARLGNDAETELAIAAAEQAKITRLRLEKLVRS